MVHSLLLNFAFVLAVESPPVYHLEGVPEWSMEDLERLGRSGSYTKYTLNKSPGASKGDCYHNKYLETTAAWQGSHWAAVAVWKQTWPGQHFLHLYSNVLDGRFVFEVVCQHVNISDGPYSCRLEKTQWSIFKKTEIPPFHMIDKDGDHVALYLILPSPAPAPAPVTSGKAEPSRVNCSQIMSENEYFREVFQSLNITIDFTVRPQVFADSIQPRVHVNNSKPITKNDNDWLENVPFVGIGCAATFVIMSCVFCAHHLYQQQRRNIKNARCFPHHHEHGNRVPVSRPEEIQEVKVVNMYKGKGRWNPEPFNKLMLNSTVVQGVLIDDIVENMKTAGDKEESDEAIQVEGIAKETK